MVHQHSLGLHACSNEIIHTYLVTSYNHTGINSGCKSDASTLKATYQQQGVLESA